MAASLIRAWFLAIIPGEPSLSHAVPPVAGAVQQDDSTPLLFLAAVVFSSATTM